MKELVLLLATLAAGQLGDPYENMGPNSVLPDCSKEPLKSNGVCDTSKSATERAKALIDAMTVNEKINQTGNEAQGVERLGLPAYNWWSEALHGVAQSPGVTFDTNPDNKWSHASSFPAPILTGASFDDDLVHDIAQVIGTEARAFSNGERAGLDFWTPNINPFKDPRWGRGQETPGEDVLHLQNYVYNLIHGLQGVEAGDKQKAKRIIATCKHFATYDLENWHGNERYGFDAKVTPQDLSEYYLPTFKTCARDAGAGGVMCSYNAMNGIPTCASKYLMQDILRDHWGWSAADEWVVADCDAAYNIFDPHNYTDTLGEATADALKAGCDLDCGKAYFNGLPDAYKQSRIGDKDLDRALTRLYASLVNIGYFDAGGQEYAKLGWSDVNSKNAQELALRAAQEGIVLLKNKDQTLPLQHDGSKKLAIIGPYGNATTAMQSNYQGPAPYLHSPLFGAENSGAFGEVHFVQGADVNSTNTTHFDEAVQAAKDADIILFAGGIDQSIESEGLDRNSIVWPQNQLDLLSKLEDLNKPLIVAQFGGGQLDDSELLSNDKIGALLWAGYPGQDGGVALFDIITGKVAPSGRLPVTQYPGKYADEVPMTDMTLRPSDSNPGRTYRWYSGDAVLPFGYGLHYTDFSTEWQSKKHSYKISKLSKGGDSYNNVVDNLKLKVYNKGNVDSDYVALVFAKSETGPKPYPLKTLVGYARAKQVKAGKHANVQVEVKATALARVNENGDSVLYPGDYDLEIDVDGKSDVLTITLEGDEATIDKFPQEN